MTKQKKLLPFPANQKFASVKIPHRIFNSSLLNLREFLAGLAGSGVSCVPIK